MPKRKITPKLGDIVQIPLPNGKYAYGRIYKDTGLAIYKELSALPNMPPRDEKYQFMVGFNGGAVESGQWSIIDNRPFSSEKNAWPPPMYMKDALSGKFSIYHEGKIKPASEEQCKGLEKAAVWNANHIIDRIIGTKKWN